MKIIKACYKYLETTNITKNWKLLKLFLLSKEINIFKKHIQINRANKLSNYVENISRRIFKRFFGSMTCLCVIEKIRKIVFACLHSVHNTISLSRHEQVCLIRLRFERYFSYHGRMVDKLIIKLFRVQRTYAKIVTRREFYLPKKYSCGRSFLVVNCPYTRKFKILKN